MRYIIAGLVVVLIAMIYYAVTYQPPKPSTVVVRPSNATTPVQPPQQQHISTCTKQFYIRIRDVQICTDSIYSVVTTNDGIVVEFGNGIITGRFTFLTVPECEVVTLSAQGVYIPCRAQIFISVGIRK
jgi:hypothetical protein